MNWDPIDLYNAAVRSTTAAAGFYNHNVRVATAEGPVLVRIPIPNADTMDLAIWPEAEILKAVTAHVSHAPRLLHAQQTPRFQILEFVAGDRLDERSPRGIPVPGHVTGDVVRLLGELGGVPRDQLPPAPGHWPSDGDTEAFGQLLSKVTLGVHEKFGKEFGTLFESLGMPTDPLAVVLDRWHSLTARPFRLLHTDIHRKNMILTKDGTFFLDWELALWGDPVYEVAVHFHKMGYRPEERAAVLTGWLHAVGAEVSSGWPADLDTYLAHERVKSAVVDSIRYAKLFATEDLDANQKNVLVAKLTEKINAAREVWGQRQPIGSAAVRRALGQWCHG